jgi:hypothetical protein
MRRLQVRNLAVEAVAEKSVAEKRVAKAGIAYRKRERKRRPIGARLKCYIREACDTCRLLREETDLAYDTVACSGKKRKNKPCARHLSHARNVNEGNTVAYSMGKPLPSLWIGQWPMYLSAAINWLSSANSYSPSASAFYCALSAICWSLNEIHFGQMSRHVVDEPSALLPIAISAALLPLGS